LASLESVAGGEAILGCCGISTIWSRRVLSTPGLGRSVLGPAASRRPHLRRTQRMAQVSGQLAARPGKQDWMAEACYNTLPSRRESVDPSALHPAARTPPSRTGNKSAPSEFFSSLFLP
jgi:hypothetical protein